MNPKIRLTRTIDVLLAVGDTFDVISEEPGGHLVRLSREIIVPHDHAKVEAKPTVKLLDGTVLTVDDVYTFVVQDRNGRRQTLTGWTFVLLPQWGDSIRLMRTSEKSDSWAHIVIGSRYRSLPTRWVSVASIVSAVPA